MLPAARDVKDHIISQKKRPGTFVMAPSHLAAIERPAGRLHLARSQGYGRDVHCLGGRSQDRFSRWRRAGVGGRNVRCSKGVEHKPYAEHEVKLMLIEPRGVLNTGHEGGGRTAQNDVWI